MSEIRSLKNSRIQGIKRMNNLIRIPLYIIAFILLGLLFGYLTFKILSFSRTVEVPDLIGKSLVEANELLSRKGLYLKIEGEDYDSTFPPGYILRQDVPVGNKVKERRSIKVIVSKGPRVQSVPMLVNETLSEAESIVIQKGLKVSKIIRVHSERVEKDKVLAQKPEPDQKVSDYITLVVSLGPHEVIYYCPDFRGMSVEQAKELAEKLNLKLRIKDDGVSVSEQKPRQGTHIRAGETIYLRTE
ncbi:MAG: PASTA domain-containing protein [Nitrospirota bacterium]